MKTNLLNAIALAIVMTTCYNCSVEPLDNLQITVLDTENIQFIEESTLMNCENSDPKLRLTNNGTLLVEYHVYGNNGTLISVINNVQPGTVTEWTSFPEGNVVIDVKIHPLPDQKVIYAMETCTELNLEVDVSNQLTDAEPQSSSN